MFGLKFNPFQSLTIMGVVPVIGSLLVQHFDPSALSPTLHLILQAAGGIVSLVGLRNSVAKAVADVLEAMASK